MKKYQVQNVIIQFLLSKARCFKSVVYTNLFKVGCEASYPTLY